MSDGASNLVMFADGKVEMTPVSDWAMSSKRFMACIFRSVQSPWVMSLR